MNASSKEAADSSTGTQQGNNTNDTNLISKGQSSSSSSPWLRLKDPRIVRVSRAFGGKDRHSKVCTIRGLRDRRVRLSVPTAIQLYDLQDRLGLNQPSKVVDWLLDAAKDEIDELPPLPFPPSGTFGLNHQMLLGTSQEQGLKTSSTSTSMEDPDAGELSRSSFWNSDDFWRAKCKEIARETTNQKDDDHHHGAQQQVVSSNHSSTPTMLSNNAASYGSYYHFEPPNFASSHSGTHGFASHTEELHNFNVVPLQLPLPSTLSLSSASQMLDPRQQVNHFQMLSSAAQTILPSSSLNPPPYSLSQSIRPFHLSITPMFPHPQNSNGAQPDNELRK